jgi:hypothetical protein
MMKWFAVLCTALLLGGGVFGLDIILKLFALPSTAAVLLGLVALVVIAALEYYGLRLAFKILTQKRS